MMKQRLSMLVRTVTLAFLFVSALTACTANTDSCDDLRGEITGRITQITGFDSVILLKRLPDSTSLEMVDQVNGTDFSNLLIDVSLSWTEEQRRFEAPSTFTQSLLDWFVQPAVACTLVYEEAYRPGVGGLTLFSDSDFNADYPAGSDLGGLFTVPGAVSDGLSISDAIENGRWRSDRRYVLEPAMNNVELVSTPDTPRTHVFTITLTLENGEAYTVRTSEVLLTGT